MGVSLSNNYVLASIGTAAAIGLYQSVEKFNAIWTSLNCPSILDRYEYFSLVKINPPEQMYVQLDAVDRQLELVSGQLSNCYYETTPYLIAVPVCASIAAVCLSYLLYKCCR